MHINALVHDNARQYKVVGSTTIAVINEPHTVDTAKWERVTDLSRKCSTTLVRETVTVKPSSIRGPHYKAPKQPRTIEAITNATHTRHARRKGRSTNYYTPKGY